MIERWNRFWYAAEPTYDPMGLIRMAAVFCYAKWNFSRDFHRLQDALDLPPELIPMNLGLRLLPFPYPLPADSLDALYAAMVVAGTFAFIGFLTRPALFILATGALYLASGRAALSLFDHEEVLTLAFLWILAVYPSGKSFSLDAMICWWRRGRPEGRPFRTVFSLHRRNAWGYRLALAALCIVYVTAGVSKLRYSEGEWLNGETLSFYLSRDSGVQVYLGARWEETAGENWKSPVPLVDHAYGAGARPWVRPFGRNLALMRCLSIATVALELAAPLILGPPVVAALFMAAAFAMHTSMDLAMYLGFPAYRLFILLLVDWPALINTGRSSAARRLRRGEHH